MKEIVAGSLGAALGLLAAAAKGAGFGDLSVEAGIARIGNFAKPFQHAFGTSFQRLRFFFFGIGGNGVRIGGLGAKKRSANKGQ